MILTIDIGTSFFKTAIWDYEGSRIAFASSELAISLNKGLRYETDSAQWLKAFEDCCRKLSATAKLSKIKALVICGNGPSLTPVLGVPSLTSGKLSVQTAPVRIWLDKRAVQAAKEVSALAGGSVDPCFFLPKALDIKNSEPMLYDKTKYFLGCPEFLAYALTGEARTILPSDGFNRWFWTDEILLRLGLEKEKFPPFIRPGETFGQVISQTASYFGFLPGIPVISGGPDFFAAIFGSGVKKPRQACIRTGTSSGINVCTETQIFSEKFMSYAHPVIPYWNLSGIISSTGKAIEWVKNILNLKDYKSFFSLAETAPVGAGGLVFLPSIAGGALGERAFSENTAQPSSVGGMFYGLNLSTGSGDFTRSVLEGINFAILDIALEMEKAGAIADEFYTAGSIFQNDLINQMKADILQRPIFVPQYKEAELLGLAIIGFTSCGRYSSFIEAASDLLKIEKTFLPEKNKISLYNDLFLKYHTIKV